MFGRGKRRRDGDDGGERSGAGDPILRHESRDRPFEPSTGAGARRNLEAVERHLVEHLGPDPMVWHELVSDLVHVDVFLWWPTPERPMYTLATVGMSERRMTLPRELRHDREVSDRAELVLCLPSWWPVPEPGTGDRWGADDYYPVEWLRRLARLPHEFDTWLGFGHTVPNGDPAHPFTSGTDLAGWILLSPITLPQSFWRLDRRGAPLVDFFGVVGVHADEMDQKLARGTNSLFAGFNAHQVTELLDPRRRSTAGWEP